MSFNLRLLEVLADGEFHSGTELGERAGVSRAAIWKQLQQIRAETALIFESVKGKGYRLTHKIEFLNAAQIRAHLPAAQLSKVSLEIYPQLDSTNRLALDRAQTGDAHGYVVLAEHQLAGRGRRGKAWVSPFGANLYLSLVWGFDSGAAALEGLSLAVGVGMARALDELGFAGIGLKWPNDIYWRDRKLGGILLEMVGDAAGPCQVVIGIGVNVRMPQPGGIDQPWCDLHAINDTPVSRNLLAATILAHLLAVLGSFERDGFALYRDEWHRLDCMRGRPVTLTIGEKQITGTAAGVGDSGALAIDTALGREWFHGGEVSLRLRV